MNRLFQSTPKAAKNVVAGAAFLFVLPAALSTASAQCTGVCGDVNSNGTITFVDVYALFPYISSADSAGLDMQCADMDDRAGVTLRDLVTLLWSVWFNGNRDCEINLGPFVPMSNPGYLLHHNSVFPAGDTLVTLYVDATFGPDLAQGVSLVLRVRVDGEIPTISGVAPVTTSGDLSWEMVAFGSGTGNIPVGYLMGAFFSQDFDSPGAGRFTLGRANLVMPASGQARMITLEQVEFPVGANKTMVHDGVYGDTDVWALNLTPWIIELTGDVNNDRALTSSDIIGLVNYVFKGGPAPYPFAATSDVNCSGTVTSSDLIGLVNHVFKGGTAPCDVATECTVTIDSWTCP